jgi:hypothetical protein
MPMVTIDPKWNFHNCAPLRLRVFAGAQISANRAADMGYPGEALYHITDRQAARVRRHFCGVSGCACNSGSVIRDECYDQYLISVGAKANHES